MQAWTTGRRSGSRAGAGHNSVMASRDAAPASSHPASRSGIELAGARSETGRMNASSSEVDAPARAELTTPANSTKKPTTSMARAASQAAREASVARQAKTAPVRIRATWSGSRSRIRPPNATNSSMDSDPNAAKVAMTGLPITLMLSASRAGMTIAARPDRRSASRPASRDRSQRRLCLPARSRGPLRRRLPSSRLRSFLAWRSSVQAAPRPSRSLTEWPGY